MSKFLNINKTKKVIFWSLLICLLATVLQIFIISAQKNSSTLIINEFMAANGVGITDEDGDYSDWIEIYNRSNQPVNLSDWSITDNSTQLEKWVFPDIVLGSNEYLVIFASGKDRKSTELGAELHTNFRLSKMGEFLGLYSILDDKLIKLIGVSSAKFPKQFEDMSYGRYNEAVAYGYFMPPTPGEPNNSLQVWWGIVANVEFSVERGFYDSPFLVELTSAPDATIYYTTDGSEPTESTEHVYSHPIPIENTTIVRAIASKPNFLPSFTTTHTYIFPDQVLTQPANPPGFPPTWGIHSENFKSYVQGSPVMADYEMDPDIVNHPRYKDKLKDGLKSIPTLSIAMDRQSFSDIYSNPRDRGIAWERPASIEFIDSNTNVKQSLQVNAGIRIHGGVGRREFLLKHSFRLFFRNQYGASELDYPLFFNSSVDKFNTLVLRAGADRSFAGTGSVRKTATYTRDEWLRISQIEMSGVSSHGIFVHLYINGLYWGLYNVIERPDEAFMESYFGGSKDEWLIVNHDGPLRRDLGDQADALNRLFTNIGFIGRADDNFKGREIYAEKALTAIRPYIDTIQFSDYIILNWYAGTEDWPENNWYAAIQNPDGQFRLFVWDGQGSWKNGAKIGLGKTSSSRLNVVKPVFELLIRDSDFKMEFADRMYKHLFNNGVLTDANAQARWQHLSQTIEQAIVDESARWGDVRSNDTPITQDDWYKAQSRVLTQMEGNVAKLITLAREAGYYPMIDPPKFNQHGGGIDVGFTLSMTAPSGDIYYTTNGTDPRQSVTGNIASDAILYDSSIILTATTQIRTRTRTESSNIWSALNETTFNIVESDDNLRLTEIMYNPSGDDEYEFVELQNIGDIELNLAGTSFEGINFTFPSGTPPVAPDTYLVLVRNPTAFAERYPEIPIAGVYKGQLSNKGEKITVTDKTGKILATVGYDDENGWPISPDGRGDSLVLVDLTGDPNNSKSWRASTNIHGSPGIADPGDSANQ
ncbi:lamin tail domain-containing protein [Anaerolineales bacterium HSG24]|nr:lamin tail domain-containing protein [Anaerolineales bacterium HSG24]